jgi:hypothetical protein
MPLLQKRATFVSSGQNRFLIQPVCPPKAPPERSRQSGMVWLELVAGLMSVVLLVLALLSPHWVELLVGLSPDAGDGSAEFGIALLWAIVSALMFALAGRTWKKQIRVSSTRPAVER